MGPDNVFPPDDSVHNNPDTGPSLGAEPQPSQPEQPAAPKTDLHNFQFDPNEPASTPHLPGGEIRPSISPTVPPSQQPIVAPPAMPSAPTTPQDTPPAPVTQPTVQPFQAAPPPPPETYGSSFVPSAHAPAFGTLPHKTGKSKRFKLLVAALAAILLFGGSASAYYFAYYMNPNTIWSQSLSNTAKGYSALVDYLNTTSNAHYKGVSEDGSFKYQINGQNFDGNMSFKSDGTHSSGSMDVGLALTRVKVNFLGVKPANADMADLYFQANGIKGLGDFLGSDFGKKFNNLDGQWIVIDHTLLEDIKSQVTKSASNSTTLNWPDVVAAAKSFGDVNKQYVFTTKKDKSVTTVVKQYGVETINGHKVYHYKVGFVKQNVKSYITALRDALKSSKLGTWLTAETGKSIDDTIGYTDLEKSADNIKSSDTIDVWSDVHTRLIYKVRVSGTTNPAENYADIGLDYKGGGVYPFFLNSMVKSGSTTEKSSFTATLNTNTREFVIKLNDNTTGDTKSSLSGTFTFKPSNDTVSVTIPKNAKTLSAVLDELGLGDLFNALLSEAAAASSTNGNSVGSFGSSL
jgi:hypothetical protein